jgi:hypothetical protein
MRHRRRSGTLHAGTSALGHRRFRRRRRQRAAGRTIGLRISNLALEQAGRTRSGDGEGGGRAGGGARLARQTAHVGAARLARQTAAVERGVVVRVRVARLVRPLAGIRDGVAGPARRAVGVGSAGGIGWRLLGARRTGGRLLADPPEPCSPTDHTACVGVWLSYAPPVTTTCPSVAAARRPSANVYVGHLYGR